MELLKRLRRGSTRKVLLPSLILLAAAAAVFYFFHCQAVFQTLSPKTLAELTPETLEGAYVEDDISFFYAQYVEEEEYRNQDVYKRQTVVGVTVASARIPMILIMQLASGVI